ncbi:unnamed protein product [Brassica oleracea var. botrytis]
MVNGESVHISMEIPITKRASFSLTDGAVERVNAAESRRVPKL